MHNVIVQERKQKDGTSTYMFKFEIASVGGKRKWITKSGYKSKKTAMKEGILLQDEYEKNGITQGYTTLSVSDYYDYWVEADCKVDLKESTIGGYSKIIELHIKPALGKYYLTAVTRDMLQAFLVEMYNKGFSRNSLISIKGILTKSFNFAYDNYMIPRNPSLRLKIPRNQKPDTPTRAAPHIYIPQKTINEIFDRFPEGHPSYIPLMIGYKCGLRIGETFALCWQDIDFDRKKMTINRQVQWHKDKTRSEEEKKLRNGSSACGSGFWYFTPPKFDSYRIIDLDDELCTLLQRTKEAQINNAKNNRTSYIEYYSEFPLEHTGVMPPVEQYSNRLFCGKGTYKIDLVCVRETGEYISSRTMQHTSSIVHHKLNYPDFDYHSLRHTHATMLAEAGAPPKYIQKRLGHAKIDITMNIYQHLTDAITDAGNNVLNGLYK